MEGGTGVSAINIYLYPNFLYLQYPPHGFLGFAVCCLCHGQLSRGTVRALSRLPSTRTYHSGWAVESKREQLTKARGTPSRSSEHTLTRKGHRKVFVESKNKGRRQRRRGAKQKRGGEPSLGWAESTAVSTGILLRRKCRQQWIAAPPASAVLLLLCAEVAL